MARLINAKELEAQIKEAFKDTNPVLMGQMLRWVRKQKTFDAVSVVRCKDCVHYDGEGCLLTYGEFEPNSMDFCSYGERRADA